MMTFRTYAALHLAALAVGGAVAALATPEGPVRLGAEVGVGVGALTGVAVLVFGARALTGTLNSAMAALMGGFLLRMLAVAGALLGAKALGGSPVAAAAAFLALYLVGQVLELTFVTGQWKAARVQENRA